MKRKKKEIHKNDLMATKARLIVKMNALIAVGDVEDLDALAAELKNVISEENNLNTKNDDGF